MDLPHRHHVVFLLLFLEYLNSYVSGTAWEHISLRYGTWYTPPRSPPEAERRGYRVVNNICKMNTYNGFLYVKGGNNKSRLIFDLNGNLAGIQTAIPGNMKGFNSRNDTIKMPSIDVIPPILESDDRDAFDVQLFTITAYFKHPRLICSPYAQNAHPGKGLWIQMGTDVEHQYERIPMEAKHLSPEWKKSTCRPQMGVHYFKNLSPDLPCEKLYPVFLMYNQDGLLGAFGWMFQGTPPYYPSEEEFSWYKVYPPYYPILFEEKQLPSCMFNPDFAIFGLRIYLRNKDTMICPILTENPNYVDGPSTTATTTTTNSYHRHNTRLPGIRPQPRTTHKPPSYDDTIILDDIIRERENGAAGLGFWNSNSVAQAAGRLVLVLALQALVVRISVRGLFDDARR